MSEQTSTTQPDPVSVQDVLGNAGEPPTFTWRGHTYKLGFFDAAVTARFEEFVIAAESESIRSLKGLVSDAEFNEAIARLGRLNRTREFKAGGSLWRKYVVGEEAGTGFVLHLLAMLRTHHPKISESDVKAMFEEEYEFLMLAADRAAPDFFAHAAAVLRIDPAVMAGLVKKFQDQIRGRVIR